MRRHLLTAVVTVGFLALTGSAFAVFAGGIQVKPGVYDPDKTKIVSAQWVTKEGLPDSGKSDHALVLIKAGPTPTNAAAGAEIRGVEGMPADGTYGFDIRFDSYNGAGAPRFNLLASDGFHFIGGSANGTITPLGLDHQGRLWFHVEFDALNPAQAFPAVTPGATIVSLSVIVDEDTRGAASGAVIIDNINVDGNYVGKPGA